MKIEIRELLGSNNSFPCVMCSPTVFVANIMWRMIDEIGEPEIIFIDSAPKKYPDAVGRKPPGGMVKSYEKVRHGLWRETHEETGVRVRQRARPELVYSEEYEDHLKYGFATPWSGCRGELRQDTPFEDGKSTIHRVYWIPVSEAVEVVYRSDRNRFHLNFVEAARDHIYQKLGMPMALLSL